jgi:TonB-linked SusC/RagA family outer membrane protein
MHKTLSSKKEILRCFLVGFLLTVFCSGPLWAQDRIVSGKIISADDNQGIPGVNIILKGTSQGTVTDAQGSFSINVPSSESILVFSSIGYATQEIAAGAQSVINVTLAQDVTSLSEVIVVGYGTQEKRDITASIASVSGDNLTKVANTNPLEGMKGQISGVDVLQSSGRPGQNSSITIRGRRSINASNDPLFVVDGVPMTSGTSSDGNGNVSNSQGNPLNDFNPSDIASVEVLKDAAATAIYGSRGANGVVLITTKRGKTGKTTVSYSGYYGVTQPFSTFPVMNGSQFADLRREANRVSPLGVTGRTAWEGTIPADNVVFTDPVELNSVQKGLSTNWQDLIFKNGSQVNHSVSVTGGNEKTQFSTSIGYFKQGGTISGMDFTKTTARINLDHQISKRFKIGMSNQITHSVQNNGSNAVMTEAVNQTPLGLPYDANGNIIFLPISDGIRSSPLSELVPGKKIDEVTVNRLFSSAYLEVNIIEGLKYKALFGADLRFQERGIFDGRFTSARKNGDPGASYQNEQNTGYTLENLITYNKTFGGKHNLGLTFLESIQGNKYENHYTAVTGLPYEDQKWYNLNTASTINTIRSRLEEWQLSSWMGRVNYTFNGKYLFQATIRTDGSSRLASGHQWTTFPGVSAGWRIKDESFMSNVNVVSDLKLRASYGVVGNTSIDPYKTQGALSKSVYNYGDANGAGFALDQIANPNLGWEKAATVDIGLDFGLFNGRLSGTVDVYQTNTTDILLRRNIPASGGYDFGLANVGATRTSGIELSLTANIINSPSGFRWDADFNIAHYKEEIVDLGLVDAAGNKASDTGNAWFIGQPLKVFFDYQKVGIWQKNELDAAQKMMGAYPGEIKLKDQDGNGLITPADRIVLGNDIPSAYGGLNNRFSYKGFDFSVNLYYRLGYTINSQFSTDQATMQSRYNNLVVDYWTINNPTDSYPRPNKNQENPQYNTTLRYQDGGFVKLRQVTLGYTLPKTFTDRLGIASFRVYVSGQNLFAWTSYKLFDPEGGSQSTPATPGAIGGAQIDSNMVPSNKLFLGGVNITF